MGVMAILSVLVVMACVLYCMLRKSLSIRPATSSSSLSRPGQTRARTAPKYPESCRARRWHTELIRNHQSLDLSVFG